MAEQTALPERYRLLRNIDEGYEVQLSDGEWVEVASQLWVLSPMNFVRLEFVGGAAPAVGPPGLPVMSRRVAKVGDE